LLSLIGCCGGIGRLKDKKGCYKIFEFGNGCLFISFLTLGIVTLCINSSI
jgi:hypothetical protein